MSRLSRMKIMRFRTPSSNILWLITHMCVALCVLKGITFYILGRISSLTSLKAFISIALTYYPPLNGFLFMPRNFMQKHLLALMERALFAIPVFNTAKISFNAKFMLVNWTNLGSRHAKFTCVITRDILNYLDHRALVHFFHVHILPFRIYVDLFWTF